MEIVFSPEEFYVELLKLCVDCSTWGNVLRMLGQEFEFLL